MVILILNKNFPRKKKKKIYGTKRSRKKQRKLHLACLLIDTKQGQKVIEKVANMFSGNKTFPLTILTNNINKNDKSRNTSS